MWWNLTPVQKLRRAAWALFVTPTLMLFPLTLGPFFAPATVLEYLDVYLLFFGIPYAAALALWLYARKLARTA